MIDTYVGIIHKNQKSLIEFLFSDKSIGFQFHLI